VAVGNRYANQAATALFVTAQNSGTAGGYQRVDWGAAPRLHAPPAVSLTDFGPNLQSGPPEEYYASVQGPTPIARVDFYDDAGNETWTSFSAWNFVPSSAASSDLYFGISSKTGVTATVTDLDGNVATVP
jgi:hypothetical protein